MIKRFFWLLITVGLLFVLTACEKQVHQVEYLVEGTAAEGGVALRNATNGLEEFNTSFPWQRTFEVESYHRVVLQVRNRTNQGTVRCEIKVDGEIISEAESSGGFKLARCEGMIVPPTPTPPPAAP